MTLIFFLGGGGEEVRWKTVRTYGKILATPLVSRVAIQMQIIAVPVCFLEIPSPVTFRKASRTTIGSLRFDDGNVNDNATNQ